MNSFSRALVVLFVLTGVATDFPNEAFATEHALRDRYNRAKEDAIGEVYNEVLDAPVNAAWKKALDVATKKKTSHPIKDAADDLAVPEAPALSVLGVTAETVIRPTSPRQLAVDLLEGLDPKGEPQTGLALQTSPFLLLGGNEITIQDYQSSYSTRLLSRVGLSFATSKGSNDDKSFRFATGLTVTPWDRGDPRMSSSLLDCMDRAMESVVSTFTNFSQKLSPRFDEVFEPFDREFDRLEASATSSDAEKEAEMLELVKRGKEAAAAIVLTEPIPESELATPAKAMKACRSIQEDENWNASAWNIGLAPAWTSPDGDVGGLEWSGLAMYSTFAYGFEEVPLLRDSTQFLLHGRYHMNEDAPLSGTPGSFIEQDSLTLSGQLRIAGFDISRFDTKGGKDLNFLGEVSYIKNWRDTGPDETAWRYSVGAEYRLTDSLYLKASLGTQEGDGASNDESFVLFNLKWNFSESPSLGG